MVPVLGVGVDGELEIVLETPGIGGSGAAGGGNDGGKGFVVWCRLDEELDARLDPLNDSQAEDRELDEDVNSVVLRGESKSVFETGEHVGEGTRPTGE